MIIGLDASRANRPHKSGTEWYSFHVIKWLAQLDKKNQYILYSDKPLRGGLLDLADLRKTGGFSEESEIKYDKKGFQILKSPHHNFKAKILKWPFAFLWTQGRLSWEMLFHSPDVLFIPAHTLPLIHPRNSIVTIHDIGFKREHILYPEDKIGPEDKSGRKIINLLVKIFTGGRYGANSRDYLDWSTNYALKKARKIITVSNFSRQEIREVYGAPSEKIMVIYNGYNNLLYFPGKEKNKIQEVLAKYDLEQPYILYVGRLEKKKNIPGLIEAFAYLRAEHPEIKHKLFLIGSASHGYDEANFTIEEFQLDEEVIMPGWIEESDMPAIFEGASVFVFPSLYEGFGIPLLQAMACRVPIAAAETASIPEVAGEAACFFPPRDIKAMAETIAKVILDDDLRRRLIKKGEERVKNFSWEKCARETLEILAGN